MVSSGIGERMVFVLISNRKFVGGLTVLNTLISLSVWALFLQKESVTRAVYGKTFIYKALSYTLELFLWLRRYRGSLGNGFVMYLNFNRLYTHYLFHVTKIYSP